MKKRKTKLQLFLSERARIAANPYADAVAPDPAMDASRRIDPALRGG